MSPRSRGRLSACYQACLRGVQFPVYALDMVDRQGRPDHGKIVPFIVVQEILFLLWRGHLVPTTLAVVMLSAVFGNSMFRAFLRKSEFKMLAEDRTEREEKDVHIVNEIIRRRDPAAGIDPA